MLQEIIRTRKVEIEESRRRVSEKILKEEGSRRGLLSLREFLGRPGPSVIAEIKYRSPSHGPFRCQSPVEQVARGYVKGGARALSILTDSTYFGGSVENLKRVYELLHEDRPEGAGEDEAIISLSPVPLLRKDFIVDRYQMTETRAFGASAFLLIAAALKQESLRDLRLYGEELGLEALVEVHDAYELEAAMESGAQIIGVNNRNLNTFEVDLRTSFDIGRRLEGESGLTRVAESGIDDPSQVLELWDAGFDAFLIGTRFMETSEPGKMLGEFVDALEARTGVELREIERDNE